MDIFIKILKTIWEMRPSFYWAGFSGSMTSFSGRLSDIGLPIDERTGMDSAGHRPLQ